MYYIYMLRCEDNSIYTGITNDIAKRYSVHLSGAYPAAKYTRSRKIRGIEAIWITSDKSHALRLESRIKKLRKSQKEKLITNPLSLPPEVEEGQYSYIGRQLPDNDGRDINA